MLNGFIIASPGAYGDRGYIALQFYPDLTKPSNVSFVRVMPADAFWDAGLGLVRRPDGHSLASTLCGNVPLEVLGNWINTERLNISAGWTFIPANRSAYANRLAGVSTSIQSGASSCPASLWPGVFDGYRLERQGYPLAVALDGVRVDLQRGAVAGYLSRNIIRDFTPEQFFSFSRNTVLQQNAPSVQPPGQPAGLWLLDNRVWVTNCGGLIQANGSKWPATPVSSYPAPIGGSLFCLF